jgi:uncharacterized cupredoxin-like copper-binding protein
VIRPTRIPSRRGLLGLGVVLVIAAAASLGLAACGGDDNGDESSTSAASTSEGAATSGGGETVKIAETDFKLDPSDPTVKAGTVSFDVTNDGQTTHNLEVEGPNGEEELPNDLAPGDKGTLSVDLSKPGKYEMYCPVDGHKEQGMEGEITVE